MEGRDIPTPPASEVLRALLDAVISFDHWRQIDSGCNGAGPVVMAFRALDMQVPAEIAAWVATCPDSVPPFKDDVGYPWSTNPRIPPLLKDAGFRHIERGGHPLP